MIDRKFSRPTQRDDRSQHHNQQVVFKSLTALTSRPIHEEPNFPMFRCNSTGHYKDDTGRQHSAKQTRHQRNHPETFYEDNQHGK